MNNHHYSKWHDLYCSYHNKQLVLVKPGIWACEQWEECYAIDQNNLTICKGFRKNCDAKIIAKNDLFQTKEDLYCEQCIKDYEYEKATTSPPKPKVKHCKEKECAGIVEKVGGEHICTTCGVIQESEKERNRILRINRMKMIHSKEDLPSKRRK